MKMQLQTAPLRRSDRTPCPPNPENLEGIFLADEGQKLVDADYEVFELRQVIDPDMFKDFTCPKLTLPRKNWLNPNRKPKKSFKTKAYKRACY